MNMGFAPGLGCGVPIGLSTGAILVLFILLVIISVCFAI
jgi:hypothetical protein